MDCSKFAELFLVKYENNISENDNKLFEEHYNECHKCKKYYDDYVNMMDSLENLEQLEPPRGLKESIMEKVKEEKSSKKNIIKVDFKKYGTMVAMLIFTVVVFYPMVSSFLEIQRIRQNISSIQQSKENTIEINDSNEAPTPMLRSALPENANAKDSNTQDSAEASTLSEPLYSTDKYEFDNYEVIDVSYIYIARNIENFKYILDEINNNPKYNIDSLNINDNYYNVTGTVENEWYEQSKEYLEQTTLVDKTLNVSNIEYDVVEKKAEIQSYIDQMRWLEDELKSNLSDYERQIITRKLTETQIELDFADDELSQMYEETQRVHFKILVEDVFSANGITPLVDRIIDAAFKSMTHIMNIAWILILSLIVAWNIAKKNSEKKYILEKIYWYTFIGYMCTIATITFTDRPAKRLSMSTTYVTSGVIKYNTDLNFLDEEKIVINTSKFDDYAMFLSEITTREDIEVVHETINNANISDGNLGYANFVAMVDKNQYENVYDEINMNDKDTVQAEAIQADNTVYKNLVDSLKVKENERDGIIKELNGETDLGFAIQLKQEIMQYDSEILSTQNKIQFIKDTENKILVSCTIRENESKVIQMGKELINGAFIAIYMFVSDIVIVLVRMFFPAILFYLAYKANELVFDKYKKDKKDKK